MIRKALSLQDAQIKSTLRLYGTELKFIKTLSEKNEFNEPVEGTTLEVKFLGLFHTEGNSMNVIVTTGDAGTRKMKDAPMVLCAYEDGVLLDEGFMLKLNQTSYKVKALTDIGQFHKWIDVSLEAIEDGSEQF